MNQIKQKTMSFKEFLEIQKISNEAVKFDLIMKKMLQKTISFQGFPVQKNSYDELGRYLYPAVWFVSRVKTVLNGCMIH